jgi:hypothetical protein
MLRKVILLTMMALLVTIAAWATDFVNGGFEDGNFNGWTQDGGSFNGTYSYTGDPGKSAVVGAGLDSNTLNNLPMVYPTLGSYSARVNNSDNGHDFSTLSQSVVAPVGITNIYFAWAAVLEEPNNVTEHIGKYPNLSIFMFDENTSATLYSKSFDVSNASSFVTWHPGKADVFNGGLWYYSDWQLVTLNAFGLDNDTLKLTVLASDCGLGGHGGYAYVDGFGYVKPDVPGPVVPVPPTVLLLGSGLLGLVGWRRLRKS